ncbi:DUF5629 family protein [Pseudomonas citronellolis]|uniref:DUF5629 family protein n=1 Tax=Pseudomonas citronellolis TaxID=53408 RepID=UPI0023E3CA41|nr:DUF5629 family protein [Pseudomonas citronellolis]MDF3932590.1 DUF5629 family protein [Pseudomonas citronellolis]
MSEETLYLLDQLELTDMLELDGLHAWEFSLDEDLLDRSEIAAEAGQAFSSDEVVLSVEALDGRDKRRWQFTYNQVMEAQYQAADDSWTLQAEGVEHRLRCLGAVSASGDDE